MPEALATVTATGSEQELDDAADFLRGRRIVALTGAGISTDSGIPDYRGEGAPKRNPMSFQQFLSAESSSKRYWAGSHLGWSRFRDAQPNEGHRALAALELEGVVSGVITQNVDGLHTRAGNRRVVELHGSMDRVLCLDCGQVFARSSISARIDAANPWLRRSGSVEMAPDGDAIVTDIEHFVVPDCTVCGGRLKPDVVFFGELIPVERFREAASLVQSADAMLVAGSSLVVNSGIRLLEQARRRKIPIVIVNRGVTKGDGRSSIKLDAGTSETLVGLASRLTG
jgi:NAD-dependent SIR2 family protein deacetylase